MGKIILVGLVLFFVSLWLISLFKKDKSNDKGIKDYTKSKIKEVESLIKELEIKILEAQVEADKGIKEAEDKLSKFKEQLETALKLKEKYKN